MEKKKITGILLLTAVLLTLCALLPKIVAFMQDRATIDRYQYSQMESVELNLSDRRETIPMMGKLSMMCNIEAVDIDHSQAAMTEDEVYTAAEGWMQDYEDAGIFQWFDVSTRSAAPKLGIDMTDANNYLVFWTVTYYNGKDPYQSLMLDIDDETGKILCIRYMVLDSYSMDGVWKRNKVLLQEFTDIYFSQLGMTEIREYAEANEAGYEYFERDGGVSTALYRFGDALYGEIQLEFYAEGPGGFYLYFAN